MEPTVITQTLKPRKRRRPWTSRKFVPKGVDRLSSLPDELLSHILSFLPTTNEAIQTSILSSRWKYLWTCVPNHNFQYDPNCPWRSSRAKYKSFLNTVNSLFHLSDARLSIEKFYLFSSYKTQDSPNLDAWASFLINRNMKEFVLELPNTLVCKFPNCLLTCETLVDLQLSGNFEISLPTSVSLPNLKTLYFKSVKYSNSETVQRLLSGCPILEVLTMMRCITRDDDDGNVLNISVPSLKTLYLYFHPRKFRIHIDDDEIYDYGTIIDAPNLELLQLFDYGSAYICLNNMLSLVKAILDVRLLEDSLLESGGVATNLMGILLLAISNVKCLTLYNIAIYSLSVSYDLHLPKFSKLEHLVIDMVAPGRWELLPNLLECMPKLQELVFLKGLADCVKTKFIWSAPDVAPLCLSFHLKTIVVHNFYGGVDELKLVKYMLDKAKVLEKMTICPCINSQNFVEDIWLQSRDELLNSPFGSSACQINFSIETTSS